jgi:hypothetical protein
MRGLSPPLLSHSAETVRAAEKSVPVHTKEVDSGQGGRMVES